MIHVDGRESGQLGKAQPGRIEKLEHRLVAHREHAFRVRVEQPARLVR
jgi:hypothetical protein